MDIYRQLRKWFALPRDAVTHSADRPLPEAKKTALFGGKRIFSRTLAATPEYRITLHEHAPPRDKIVITFGLVDSDLADKGFGTDFVIKNGWDTIYVAKAKNTQYQGLDVETFARVVAPALGGRQVFAYGQSIGGYCALYYGGSVDARIIALAPLNSAHRLIAKKRFADLAWNHREMATVPKALHKPVVLFDPHIPWDKTFVDGLIRPAYPDAHFVELPFAGHLIALALQMSHQLGPFVTAIIDQGIVPEVSLTQEGSYIWHAERGHFFLRSKDFPAAEAEFRKSIALEMEHRAVAGLLSVLVAQQRRADVLALLGQMTAEETGYLVGDAKKQSVLRFLGL